MTTAVETIANPSVGHGRRRAVRSDHGGRWSVPRVGGCEQRGGFVMAGPRIEVDGSGSTIEVEVVTGNSIGPEGPQGEPGPEGPQGDPGQGGRGGTGGVGSGTTAGSGGTGTTSSFFGDSATFAAGGGGGTGNTPGSTPTAGGANTGTGGGGGNVTYTAGGVGGSGIVGIRYPL